MATPLSGPPPPAVSLLDGLPNLISSSWYRFFSALYEAIKGVSDSLAALPKRFVRSTGDLNDVSGPAVFTPVDASGAGLAFAAVSVMTYRIGNLVWVYGTLTYPATADGSIARISLPVPVPNAASAQTTATVVAATVGLNIIATINASNASFYAGGAHQTNANMSGLVLNFMLVYPAG